MDKDTLIKHRFWLGLAVAVPLALGAVFLLMTAVRGEIVKKKNEIQTGLSNVDKARADVNEKHVEVQRAAADAVQKIESEVWGKAFREQEEEFTWAERFHKSFPFNGAPDHYFAREVQIKKAPEKAEDWPKDDDTKLYGTVRETKKDYILVEGANKKVVKVLRTPKSKQVDVENNNQAIHWPNIPVGKWVEVVYSKARYFYEPMTDSERLLYAQTYVSQVRPILDIVNPVNDRGEGVVQFKNWLPRGASDLPPTGTSSFFRYVKKEWDVNQDFSEEAWLAQEDLWVQREVFRVIKSANEFVSRFTQELTVTEVWVDRTHLPPPKPKEEEAVEPAAPEKAPEDGTAEDGKPKEAAKEKKVEKKFQFPADDDTHLQGTLGTLGMPGAQAGFALVDKEQNRYRLRLAPAVKVVLVEHGGPNPKATWKDLRENDKVYVTHDGTGTQAAVRPLVFTNPYWKLEVKLLPAANQLEVTVHNLLERRQKLDLDLKVRFGKRQAPEKVTLSGEPMDPRVPTAAGSGQRKVTVDLIQGFPRTGVYSVEQVLTWETAAVKRIDAVSFGTAAVHSHRTFPEGVRAFKKEEKKEEAADAKGGDLGGGMMPPGMKMGPGAMPGPGGELGKDAGNLTPHGLIKDRYVSVTDQARQIPVAVALIVDQEHVDRVQTAFANSKFRFLTTQVLLNRYPGSVRPPVLGGGQTVPDEGEGDGEAFPGAPKMPGKMGFPPGMMPPGMMPPGMGPMGGGNPFGMPPGVGPMPGGMPGMQGMPGMPGMPGGFGASLAADENETNVEIVIYGVITLYQRYPPPPQGSEPAAPAAPAN